MNGAEKRKMKNKIHIVLEIAITYSSKGSSSLCDNMNIYLTWDI